MNLIGYVLLIFAAILGAVVIACLYIAMWLVAIVAAFGVLVFRLAVGRQGDDIWRVPLKPRAVRRPIVPHARYSDRR